MFIVLSRAVHDQRLPYHGLIIEVHPEYPHVALTVKLDEVALGKFIPVFHRGLAGHALVIARLQRHIAYRSASQCRECSLPDAPGIV